MPDGGTLQIRLKRLTVKRGERPPLPEMMVGDWILIAVEDSGGGIPDEVLAHIFEPFFTTKPAGAGSGLGLAQVYGIVAQHGGSIDVDTQLGWGTLFSIYLPALTVTKNVSKLGPYTAPAMGNNECILVVEDHLPTRTALVTCLEELNYRVLTASNGREALELYENESNSIDLVLTDLVMPEMGGKALSERLYQISPDLKMIAISGYPLDGEKEVGQSGIFAERISKPVALGQLASIVAQVLARD
jgi:CheY-like chemotaxis protein